GFPWLLGLTRASAPSAGLDLGRPLTKWRSGNTARRRMNEYRDSGEGSGGARSGAARISTAGRDATGPRAPSGRRPGAVGGLLPGGAGTAGGGAGGGACGAGTAGWWCDPRRVARAARREGGTAPWAAW